MDRSCSTGRRRLTSPNTPPVVQLSTLFAVVVLADGVLVDDAAFGVEGDHVAIGDVSGDLRVRDHRDVEFAGDDSGVTRHPLVGVDDAANLPEVALELSLEIGGDGDDCAVRYRGEVTVRYPVEGAETRPSTTDRPLATVSAAT